MQISQLVNIMASLFLTVLLNIRWKWILKSIVVELLGAFLLHWSASYPWADLQMHTHPDKICFSLHWQLGRYPYILDQKRYPFRIQLFDHLYKDNIRYRVMAIFSILFEPISVVTMMYSFCGTYYLNKFVA